MTDVRAEVRERAKWLFNLPTPANRNASTQLVATLFPDHAPPPR